MRGRCGLNVPHRSSSVLVSILVAALLLARHHRERISNRDISCKEKFRTRGYDMMMMMMVVVEGVAKKLKLEKGKLPP